MPFVKGQERHPEAGRKKGTRNKVKVLRVDEALSALGVEPVHQLLRILKDGKLTPKDEARVWLDLLAYCHPKPMADLSDFEEDEGSDLSAEPTAKLLAMVRGDVPHGT